MNLIYAIILTKNEEKHLERCLKSISPFVDKVLIVDSGSDDATHEIAEMFEAEVIVNGWVNYSRQFNYGLDYLLKKETEDELDKTYILRIDADEIVDDELCRSFLEVKKMPRNVCSGYIVDRHMCWNGYRIRFGGIYPLRVVRLFKINSGRCENRWMDEHIVLNGRIGKLSGKLIDDNLNSLSWWIQKHDNYASREVLDLLNHKFHFFKEDKISIDDRQSKFKRYLKYNVYAKFPGYIGPCLYFFYRFIMRGGFLGGLKEFEFHFYQGLWYRCLVETKKQQFEQALGNGASADEAIKDVLQLNKFSYDE